MNSSPILRIAVAAMVPIVAACGDDGPSSEATNFTATLNGANEVPAVTTSATGTATFSITGNQLTYTITSTTNLQNAILGHIHLAASGVNGPVRLNLCGTGAPEPACTSGTGVVATGTNGVTVPPGTITFDDLIAAMRSGGAYVNVHTNTAGCTPGNEGCNAGGEIRGQIVPQ